MVTAWLSGDVERLSHQFMAEFGNTPALVRPLLTNRNKSWARQVEALMRRPGTQLIAVGTGHLVGRDSLQALLVKCGFRVRSVDSLDFCALTALRPTPVMVFPGRVTGLCQPRYGKKH